jgi:hypothetical protein
MGRRIAGEGQQGHAFQAVLTRDAQRVADRLVQQHDGDADCDEEGQAARRQRPDELNTVW